MTHYGAVARDEMSSKTGERGVGGERGETIGDGAIVSKGLEFLVGFGFGGGLEGEGED